MSVSLLDVNMLVALAWPSHIHHREAHNWFSKNGTSKWATCPLTQASFVRISSNPRIIPEAVTPREAMTLLGRIVQHKTHVFWPDDIDLLDSRIPCELLLGHRQVTDAYLLGLAIRRGGRLVSLDQGISALLPPGWPHEDALEIVPLR